ncbi:hypothetical protein ACN08X_07610 [Rothia sp. P6271]|uniref:hypothetical protein n=1 Tax=unclassified Rothia (in: high G+C Gram-positive bacteria) TaxID=2689056 RepID=UPI003ACE7F18
MKFAVSSTLKRAAACTTIALAALTTTGCGYIYTQPTTFQYSPSDGVSANVGDIAVRNIMVIAESADADGRVLGTILNNGKEDATVTINFPAGAENITVPAGKEIRLEDESHKLIIDPAGANPGLMLLDVKVSSNGHSEPVNIPVLDGTLPEYKPFVPNAAMSSASATPAESSGH